MAIKSEPSYYVVCDGCGARAGYSDWSGWTDAVGAEEMLDDDWLVRGDKHYCLRCWPDDEEGNDGT